MNIQRGLIFIIIASLINLPACKKEDLFRIEPSSVFYKASKEKIGSLRVFTINGEIKDQATIDRFISTDSSTVSNLGNTLFPGNTGRLDSVRFIDSKNASLHNFYAYGQYDLAQEKTTIFFKSQQTFQNTHARDLYTLSPAYSICKYEPAIFSEYLVSSTAGNYLFGYDAKNEFVLTTVAGTLKAPWIAIIARYSAGYSLNYLVQNVPDFTFYKSLNPADTVVLQQFSIVYKEK